MRACCAILILLPLVLGASVKTPDSGTRTPDAGLRPPDSGPRTPESWAPAPFSRYEEIIYRQPFGFPPPPPAPSAAAAAAAAVPPPPSFATKITLCALNRTPAGSVVAGFFDSSFNPPHNHYLAIGESEEGFTVLNADVDLEFAILDKDGAAETFWLTGATRRVLPTLEPAALAMSGNEGRRKLSVSEPAAPPTKPMFTNAIEQLLSMELSVPAGVSSPPLPITGELQTDARKALSTVIVIETNDTESVAVHKENVGLAKEEMRLHLQEGGTPVSYLQTLKDRREAEIARQKAARETAEAQLRELARKLTQEELDKQLDTINQKLGESGVDPIEAPATDDTTMQ